MALWWLVHWLLHFVQQMGIMCLFLSAVYQITNQEPIYQLDSICFIEIITAVEGFSTPWLKVALFCVYAPCRYLLSTHAYLHGEDILYTVCLFVCNFVRLRITPARIKLVASNFGRWFMGVLGKESPILGNFAPPEAQNHTNRRPPGSIAYGVTGVYHYPAVNVTLEMRRSWNIARRVDVGRHVWIYGRPGRRTYLFYLCHRRSLLLTAGEWRWNRHPSSNTELRENSSASRWNCVRCSAHDFWKTQRVCRWMSPTTSSTSRKFHLKNQLMWSTITF